MNRHQKRIQKAQLRRLQRQQAKSGGKPNPLQELNDRLTRLESSFNGNLGTLFRNHQQLKHGLDAAEINQRAMVKVAEALLQTVKGLAGTPPEGCTYQFPIKMCGIDQNPQAPIDWGVYYREAEDDVEHEKIEAYKKEVAELLVKVDQIETDLPVFEEGLDKELDAAGVVDKDHPRAQAVLRFLNDLKKEITKVRTAADTIAKNELGKRKVEEFNTRILSDAAFMIARTKAKKEEAAKKEAGGQPVVAPPDETVTEFGG